MPPNNTENTPVPPPQIASPLRRKKWPWILAAVIVVLILALVAILSTHLTGSPDGLETSYGGYRPQQASSTAVSGGTNFANPQPITIQGYSGKQEDPNLTPDGQYLFFDDHDDVGSPIYIYWAKRVDYKTFTFLGRVPGVNLEAVEGMEDLAHNFYLVSPILLGQGGQTTIGHGVLSDSSVTNVAPIHGLSPKPVPSGSHSMTFDLYITPDGNTLYFSDFVINPSSKKPGGVEGAQLAMATKNADGSFTRSPDSDAILKNVNAIAPLVYNAAPSADGLMLAFNATPGYGASSATLHIFLAKRSSVSEPFGEPQVVTAADLSTGQLSEPGSFSSDGKYLYFHRVLTPTTSQLEVLTRQ